MPAHPQVKLRHADQEIRLAQDPFPLYPGETLKQVVTQLKVVPANTALRLRAILDFQEDDGTRRVAGDEWLFEGPGEREGWGRRKGERRIKDFSLNRLPILS